MVRSYGTWNTDELGLGRPKALPSSVPCRVSVIWMVLSGRHMLVNVHWLHKRLEVLRTVSRPHATSTNPLLSHGAAHLYTSCSPPSRPTFSILVFICTPVRSPNVFLLWSHHVWKRTRPLRQMYVLPELLCVYRGLNVCLYVRVWLGLA